MEGKKHMVEQAMTRLEMRSCILMAIFLSRDLPIQTMEMSWAIMAVQISGFCGLTRQGQLFCRIALEELEATSHTGSVFQQTEESY